MSREELRSPHINWKLFISWSLILISLIIIIIIFILLYIGQDRINDQMIKHQILRRSNIEENKKEMLREKQRLNCSIVILGAGAGGSHSAYRLGPIYKNEVCVFEQNDYVGGRVYDIDMNGNSPPAYDQSLICPQGAERFYKVQMVIKELADELNISYSEYTFENNLIKTRGKYYTSINEMCSMSYVNLTCQDDSNGFNSRDQLWKKLVDEYKKNRSVAYNFGDFPAYCRYVLGNEALEFLQESFQIRSYFQSINAYSFLERYEEEINLEGTTCYPDEGMSQFPKRMMFIAQHNHHVQLFLNEQVLSIEDNINNNEYPFLIETTRYKIICKELILAMDPFGWKDITGSIANQIKNDEHFQSIYITNAITISSYWPNRWWEQTNIFGTNIDRAWTKQNCISLIEILSDHPRQKELNLTRIFYDDVSCYQTWLALIQRSSQQDLIDELVRALQSIFVDVQIKSPRKVFTKVWESGWHFQKDNSRLTNEQIAKWSLNPLPRFNRNQLTLIGEAFYLTRSAWIEGAIKSSLIALTSQFNLKFNCYENDGPSNGRFCPSDFIL